MEKLLSQIFEEATNILFIEDVCNILNNVTERNLCGRLSIYLTDKLKEYGIAGYYADIEYNRNQGKVKTILDDKFHVVTVQCDLIVHSRGSNKRQDNLLAIEMKKSTRPEAEKIKDRERLRALTKKREDNICSKDGNTLPENVCGYILGIYMILNVSIRICALEFYQKGAKVCDKIISF